MAIFLRPIDQSNYRDVLQLSVAPDQERFVASNLQSLADAYVWREAGSLMPCTQTTSWSASLCSTR
jgi:diamine N-acetyltransferase